METILELKQGLGEMYDEGKAIVDKADRENRELTGAEESRYNAIVRNMEARKVEIERRERLEGFTGVSRPEPQRRGGSSYRSGPAYQGRHTMENSEAVFMRWMQSGDEGARSEAQAEISAEYRANDTTLNITTAADGGDLVPVDLARTIFAKAAEVSIYDKLGLTQVRGVGTTVDQPVEDGDLNLFVETGESVENDRDAPAYDKVSFTLRKYTKRQDLTGELLQDTPTNLQEHVADYVGRAYAATIDNEVVDAALAGGTAAVTWDSATALAASEIPELAYTLTGGWEHGNSVAWVMARGTEGHIRSIASSSVFTFAPTPGGSMSPQSMLWGWPVFSSSHMPAIGSGNKSVILANWRAMGIRIEPVLTVIRDIYSRAAFDEVRFHWKFRMDTEVLNASGLQYGTHTTA